MKPRLLAVAGVAMLALAGCGGGNGGSGADPSASASADNKPAALEVAQCMRANGFPNFPDPTQDNNGDWNFPQSADNNTVPPACDAAVRAMKAASRGGRGPSAAEMAQRRAYAKCLREHGIADFPDPDSDGNYPITEAQRAQENSQQAQDARRACVKLAPPRDPNKPAPGSS